MSEQERIEKRAKEHYNMFKAQIKELEISTTEDAITSCVCLFSTLVASLELRIEALEATKISGDTRIGVQPKYEQNGF